MKILEQTKPKNNIRLFESQEIRTAWGEEAENGGFLLSMSWLYLRRVLMQLSNGASSNSVLKRKVMKP